MKTLRITLSSIFENDDKNVINTAIVIHYESVQK